MSKLVVNSIEDSSGNSPYSPTVGTDTATTSGTSVDITGIPSGVKQIIVMCEGISTNGLSDYMLQLGDSGGIETSGYEGRGNTVGGGYVQNSSGFVIALDINSSAQYHGQLQLYLKDEANETWSLMSRLAKHDTTASDTCAGTKSLSAEIDRIRLTTIGGTDTFDAGSFSIQYM